jgi:hypothetical protein
MEIPLSRMSGWCIINPRRREIMVIPPLLALAAVLTFEVGAGEFKHITIDGSFDDWAGVPVAFQDPADSTTSADYGDIYVANDADYLYLRFTLQAPRDPFTSHENIFIDTDNDPATGFPFHGIGSEMLIQGGIGYAERAGTFNDGSNVSGLDWAAAPTGSGTNFEVRISRHAAFTSEPPGPAFLADTISFVLEAETSNFTAVEFAPDDGGFTYTFAPTPSAAGTNRLLIALGAPWAVNSSGTDLGTAWRDPGYDDTQNGWTTGNGLFGFTTNAAAYPAPIQTALTGNTWYLRTHFQWSNDPASIILVASNYLSDGAVFYLNGTEVKRVRLPSGDISFATPALGGPATKGAAELAGFATSPLVVGDNVLAVEVHQTAGDTADLVFGTSLTAAHQFPAAFADAALPLDRTVGAGDPTTFTADFVGTEPLSFQWLKSGKAIAGATNATLTLDPVLQADAGNYALRIANSLGTNTSRAALLTVTNSPVRITSASDPADQSVMEGLAATFTVEAVGSAPINYQWFKGSDPISGATNATYVIEDAGAADAGNYLVVVTNPFPSSVTSRTARLTVTSDTIAPTVATVSGTPNKVTLTFSEPIDPTSATNASDYSIAGLSVTNAIVSPDDPRAVILTTSAQTLGQSYSVTVKNVRDRFNNTIAANTQANFKSSIVIDGSFDDWANVPLAFTDPEDSTDSLDYKDVYVTSDDNFIYMRVTLWRPGDLSDFHNNIFIDADQDVTTGYSFSGIGSDVLIQSGAGYEQVAGTFNNGTVSGLDWQIAPAGSVSEVEFRISRNAIYDSTGARVFTTNMIAFALEAENTGFSTRDTAPDAGGFAYSLGSSELGPLTITIAPPPSREVSISWEGPGRLQTKSSLGAGTWTDVQNASSPFVVTTSGKEGYFRLAQ